MGAFYETIVPNIPNFAIPPVLSKLLCFITIHKWVYSDSEHRKCIHCPRREEAEDDEYFNATLWHRVD